MTLDGDFARSVGATVDANARSALIGATPAEAEERSLPGPEPRPARQCRRHDPDRFAGRPGCGIFRAPVDPESSNESFNGSGVGEHQADANSQNHSKKMVR
jgi:hypothetical protein